MRQDWIIWLGCISLFLTGVIWGMIPDKTGFFIVGNVHDLFDIFGAVATIVAATVAVVALTSWRRQFRHTARFDSLKKLKDAATELHSFRRYLLAIQARYMAQMRSQEVKDNSLAEMEESAREVWLAALHAYNQAWGTAVVFFTPEEEASFSGPAPLFVKKSLDDPLRIVMTYANAPKADDLNKFNDVCREITDEARHLYAQTVSELEMMLRQKYRD